MTERSTWSAGVRRRAIVLTAAVALLLGAPAGSAAEPVKCQRSILKQSDVLARAVAKALRQCEEQKRKGRLAPDTVCATEPKTAARIAKAKVRLAARVAKDCGGKDKTCGTGDDDALAVIGWPVQCPDFAGAGCTQAIASCSDVATCVGCAGGAVADRTVALAYAELVLTDKRQQRKLYKCQGTLGAELLKLHDKQSKALAKCWDQRHKGKHANLCPEPGDGKAAPAVAKLRAKLVAKVCKVCGGADKACGGGDDFSPGEIGFPAACPDVGTCGGPVATLGDLAECLTCVADFGVGCALGLSVPGLASYPGACAAAVPTPTPSATPTADPSASTTPLVVGTPTATATPTVTSTTTATPTASPTPTPSATPTGTPQTTATPTSAPSATPTSAPCTVGSPGTATTVVSVDLTTGQPIGAASLLLTYPPGLVRLPTAGGGTAVRDRVTDLTGGELFNKGSPNNQDADGDQVPDRVRLSLVSTTGVTGMVLAVELDRCDGAPATTSGDYGCTLAQVVGIDGVTSIAGAACTVAVAP